MQKRSNGSEYLVRQRGVIWLRTAFLLYMTVLLGCATGEIVLRRMYIAGAGRVTFKIVNDEVQVWAHPVPKQYIGLVGVYRSHWPSLLYSGLNDKGHRWVIANLFPEDEFLPEGVIHHVRYRGKETLYLLNTLFVYDGDDPRLLLAANPDKPTFKPGEDYEYSKRPLLPGERWWIPREILHSALGGKWNMPFQEMLKPGNLPPPPWLKDNSQAKID